MDGRIRIFFYLITYQNNFSSISAPICDILIVIKAKEAKKERSSVRSDEVAAKFEHVIGFSACYFDNIYRGVLDTRMNQDISVDGQSQSIRIRYAWTRNFSNPQ